MKKLLSIILLAVLCSACLSFSVFADTTNVVTFSEDYKTLTLNEKTYTRADVSSFQEKGYHSLNYSLNLNNTQEKEIDNIEIQPYSEYDILRADIYFKDGAHLIGYYLNDSYMDFYQQLKDKTPQEYIIYFDTFGDDALSVTRTALFGETEYLSAANYSRRNYYGVNAISSDGALSIFQGTLISLDGDYYYADLTHLDIDRWYQFQPNTHTLLSVHKITDQKLIEKLKTKEIQMGVSDDPFDEIIATLITILFFLVPIGGFILCLVLAIRTKNAYRKLYSTLCILFALEYIACMLYLTYF